MVDPPQNWVIDTVNKVGFPAAVAGGCLFLLYQLALPLYTAQLDMITKTATQQREIEASISEIEKVLTELKTYVNDNRNTFNKILDELKSKVTSIE